MNNGHVEKNARMSKALVAAAITASLLMIGSAVLMAPSTEAQGSTSDMGINNMHCAHKLAGSDKAEISGFPFHDNTKPATNLRGDCNGITPVPGLDAYSVAPPTAKPKLHAELYLKAPSGGSVEGKVCLFWKTQSGNTVSGWECGPPRSTTQTVNPEWWWDDEQLDLPSSVTPSFKKFKVGFAEDECCDEETGTGPTVRHWNGNTVLAAKISDPGGGNTYLNATGFSEWIIHDPEGDDTLSIGGVPIMIETGSKISLIDSAIQIEYDESASGGNEWTISSDNGEDIVFTWHDSKDVWEIHELDY